MSWNVCACNAGKQKVKNSSNLGNSVLFISDKVLEAVKS